MEAPRETLILVDADDREIGTSEKIDAHRRGLLHRAFSVVVWDSAGRQLLQKRALGKYHSGGLWTNACCGHPRPGEAVEAAAMRRLGEEMGFTCEIEWLGIVQYDASFENGLSEREVVHVFRGRYDGPVRPDPAEAEGYQWCALDRIRSDIAETPDRFSVWFKRYIAEEWPVALIRPSAARGTSTAHRAEASTMASDAHSDASSDMPAILARIVGDFAADSGTIHFIGLDAHLHLAAASPGIPDAVLAIIRTIPVGKGMAGLAVERAEPVTACNIQTDASGDVRPGAKATGLAGSIVVPIFDGETVVGALGVANRSERTFSDEEIARLVLEGRRLAARR
ncbi:MAG: isopentenyl-diphosphate Delta-isomerase [Hyphomicrobium sp.]|uniref:isopentenyl-diphosphate Delta-isomerase n=1 Tax=Hyphomicrobium sp. TaxID=82 RepID=UPI003D125FDA